MTASGMRLSAYYGAIFVVIGVLTAYWPVWLESRGLTAAEIGLVIGLSNICKALANPAAAHAADRTGERRRPIGLLAVAAFVVFLPMAAFEGFWPLLLMNSLLMAAFAPMVPLGESLSILAQRAGRIDYGRVRLWGSGTFVVAVSLGGVVLAAKGPESVYWMLALGFALSVAAAWSLPDLRAPRAGGRRLVLLDAVRTTPGCGWFLLAAAGVQSAHAVYYGFGTLNWLRAGLSETAIGVLWAEGVIAEIVLFAFGTRIVGRLGPARLLFLAGLAGVVRWTVTAFTADLGVMLVVQLLHAFTFGAAHLAAIHYIADRVAPELSASAQSLYAVVVAGLALGGASFLAGALYEAHGGLAYLAAAASCGLGAGAALVLRHRLRQEDHSENVIKT